MSARSIPVKQLRADAAVLESVVLQYRYATREELTPYRPGGAENPDKGAQGWLRYFIKLHRYHAQSERVGPQTVNPLGEAERMAMLRGKPATVELIALTEDGSPARLNIYPKSLAALTDCAQRDAVLGWLAKQYEKVGDDATVKGLECKARLMDEMLYQHRVLCWVVCSPGAGLPFAESEYRPVVPAPFDALDTMDVYHIIQTHQKVNALRLQALSNLYDVGPKDAARPSWAVFVANVAHEMHLRPETLLKDWSLGEVLAQHALVVKARKDAEAEASRVREAAS